MWDNATYILGHMILIMKLKEEKYLIGNDIYRAELNRDHKTWK